MIRWKSVKNSLLFGGICLCLLLLNKSLIEEYEEKDSHQFKSENLKTIANDDLPVLQSACDPAIVDELERLRKSNKKARCIANNGKEMACMRDEHEFYFPFSFIKKQYDVSGRLSKDGSRFELFTSYSRIRVPEGESYDPTGPFGHFATRANVYTVGPHPVLLSNPDCPVWTPALQQNDGEIVLKGLESAEWKGSAGFDESSERIFYHDEEKGDVVNITASGDLRNAGCYVFLDPTPRLHVVSFDWLPIENASFTILVKVIESDLLVLLNYVTQHDPRCVWND
ncbi:unnamed protein product, partial [Cylicostephanus goldi]